MAVHALANQFVQAQRRIDLDDRKRIVGAAHHGVRSILHWSSDLRRLGLDNVSIRSSAQRGFNLARQGCRFIRKPIELLQQQRPPSSANWAFENSLATSA